MVRGQNRIRTRYIGSLGWHRTNARNFPSCLDELLFAVRLDIGDGFSLGLVAEAFNDLFAKYGKPEIAPVP
jgi:hypothetical protein